MVSSTGLTEDPSSSSSATAGSYSLVSVAAAMYLMTSIAAADLGAGIALVSETRTEMTAYECVQRMSIWRWVQRKMFGLVLLLSFILLAAASIRVLFQSSFEDMDLVVGAATVLFIADVDEKVMVVLKVIPYEWRLFCVLEVIGLSGTFALLGLRATGNGDEVTESDHAGCTYGVAEKLGEDCFIYSWVMILEYLPLSVTIVSLLLNVIVPSPGKFMERHVFKNCSWKEWMFVLLLALWTVEAVLRRFYLYSWALNTKVIFLGIYAAGLFAWGLFAVHRGVFYQDSDWSTARCMSFRWTSSAKIGLFYVPTGLFLLGIMIAVILIKIVETGSVINILDPTWDPLLVADAVRGALYQAWLLWGVCRKGSSAMASLPAVVTTGTEEHESVTESQEGCSRRLPPSINLLLGWVHAIALALYSDLCFSELILPLTVRTGNTWIILPLLATSSCAWLWIGVCTAISNTKGIAFWAVATIFLDEVVFCIWMFTKAAREGSVK